MTRMGVRRCTGITSFECQLTERSHSGLGSRALPSNTVRLSTSTTQRVPGRECIGLSVPPTHGL